MDVDQARAADQALVGHPAELLGQDFQDPDFFRCAGRKADMAAFGFQRKAAPVADDQATHTQAGARADHAVVARLIDRCRPPAGAAHLHHVLWTQQADGHCLRGKVVDQMQGTETQHGGGARARDHPWMVGDARLVAIHAACHGEHALGGRHADLVEVIARRFAQRTEVHHGKFARGVIQQRHRSVDIGQREARIGSADIGNQHRLGRSGHALFPCASVAGGRKWAADSGPQLPAG